MGEEPGEESRAQGGAGDSLRAWKSPGSCTKCPGEESPPAPPAIPGHFPAPFNNFHKLPVTICLHTKEKQREGEKHQIFKSIFNPNSAFLTQPRFLCCC